MTVEQEKLALKYVRYGVKNNYHLLRKERLHVRMKLALMDSVSGF